MKLKLKTSFYLKKIKKYYKTFSEGLSFTLNNFMFYLHSKNKFYHFKTNFFLRKSLLLFFLIFLIRLFYSQEKTPTKNEIDSTYKTITPKNLYKDNIVKAIELFYKSKDINYKKGQIDALYKLAELETDCGNGAKAMEHITTLKSLSLSWEDYESYIKALNLEAKNFNTDKNHNQSIKILNLAKKYLPKIKSPELRRKNKIDINIFKWYTIESSQSPKETYKDSLIAISEENLRESFLLKDKNIRTKKLLSSSTLLATSLIEVGKQSEAEKYLKIGEEQIKTTDKNKYLVADYYKVKGDYEYRNKEKNKNYLDSALSNYNKSLEICKSLKYGGLLKKLYPQIAKVYGDKNDLEKQLLFKEKEIALKDSLDHDIDINLNEFKQKAYEIKISPNASSDFFNKSILYIILLALVGISVYIIKKYLSKRKHNSPATTEENLFENEILPKDKIDISSAKKLTSLLYEDPNAFYLSFLEAYPDFSKKLLELNPSIKSSDVEFCALIKLNLETKQIAQLKKMTIGAVEAKKYRIRRKLNISREQNIYIFISNL